MLNAPVRWMPGNGPVCSDAYSGATCANNVKESSFAPVWGSARWFGKSSNCRIALREASGADLSFLEKSSMRSGLTAMLVGTKILVGLSSVALKSRRCVPAMQIS